MNKINKQSISSLGYNFVKEEYIPKGKDEYYLRNIQHRSQNEFRQLTTKEISQLKSLQNTSDNWKKVFVSDPFKPELIQQCKFFGLIRIGKLEPFFLEFNNLRVPVGIYNSTIVSSDIGDNVAIDNVNFMSHYIIGNDVIITNVNELATTDHAKFGNGIIKKGEKESVRIWLELCNENGGRSVLPFNGMLAGDAHLWTRYRGDDMLMEKFKEFTDKKFDTQRGYYGKIGDRTVIKNTKIIKDAWIGSDAYIKGANKLKNLTINSGPGAKSQIGEGCELVNGIIGFGCRIFYGVKAVRFMMGSNSQLKYGARLINSYLADNSTISCCEVLNSLIFPAHEQHHNNSFLCAALVMGQSNIAAGATIGSNHNSRGPDGELIAGRGFWPGLCVSLKHNSKFASYTIIAKGDFPSELNIPVPFSLINNDVTNNRLVIMPGYWFMYNMYALARNAGKYIGRDNRIDKSLRLEYDFLAPDTINEIFDSLTFFRKVVGNTIGRNTGKKLSEEGIIALGERTLNDGKISEKEEFFAEGIENSQRKVLIVKTLPAYRLFKEMVAFYSVNQVLQFFAENENAGFEDLKKLASVSRRQQWLNIGGQLLPEPAVKQLLREVKSGKISGWDEIHEFYKEQSDNYPIQKRSHSLASLLEVLKISPDKLTPDLLGQLLDQAIKTKEWMMNCIYESRAKDYQNPFRKMVYESPKEMEKVIGKLSENSFINQQKLELVAFKKTVKELKKRLGIR